MANVGRIVAEVGKALGKAVVAGLGLELARVTTVFVRKRLGVDDEAPKPPPAETERKSPNVDDVEELRRENRALREELRALQAEVRHGRARADDGPSST